MRKTAGGVGGLPGEIPSARPDRLLAVKQVIQKVSSSKKARFYVERLNKMSSRPSVTISLDPLQAFHVVAVSELHASLSVETNFSFSSK
jgi:hypothetical protein